MKQLLILSGKGGTGKTTIAGAFIKLSNAEAYADCDVDAPNLHLVMDRSAEPIRTDYYGLPKAEINTDLCTKCDQFRQVLAIRLTIIPAKAAASVKLFVRRRLYRLSLQQQVN